MKFFASLSLLFVTGSVMAAAASSLLVARGELDANTNAPAITIYHTNGTYASLGTGWTNYQSVVNGDLWQVVYPSSDCQSNATEGAVSPVIINGAYTTVDAGVTNLIDVWIRMPVGYSAAMVVFYIDPNTGSSLWWKFIDATQCNPGPSPRARLSLWGSKGTDWFSGALELAGQNILDLAIGENFALALQTNSVIWPIELTPNANKMGEINIPSSLSNNVAQVACGTQHALALLNNGNVVGWGVRRYSAVPTNLTGVLAVACGSSHSLALKTNSTVAAWGCRLHGETNVPSGLTNVVQLAGGSHFSAALKDNGTVAVWGDNSYGVTNIPSGLSGVVRITCGKSHITALKTNGTIVAWGAGFTSPSVTNAVYTMSSDAGYWVVTGDGVLQMIGNDNAVPMPLTVTNVVMLSARGASHAVISGPVLLSMLSHGGSNANVTWPAAVAGRIYTKATIGASWASATNTVKYVRERKHVNVVANEASRFYRLTTNSAAVTLGLGEDPLFNSTSGSGSGPGTNRPPAPGAMMMQQESQDPMAEFEQMMQELQDLMDMINARNRR